MKKIFQSLVTWIQRSSIDKCQLILQPHDNKLQKLTDLVSLYVDCQQWQKNNLLSLSYAIDTHIKSIALDEKAMHSLLQCARILPSELFVLHLLMDFYMALISLTKNPSDKNKSKTLAPENIAILLHHFYVLRIDKGLLKTIMHTVK
jgi:hypothetical protein